MSHGVCVTLAIASTLYIQLQIISSLYLDSNIYPENEVYKFVFRKYFDACTSILRIFTMKINILLQLCSQIILFVFSGKYK